MLNWMRKIAPAIMVVVILAFAATIFLAWGMDSSTLKKVNQNRIIW